MEVDAPSASLWETMMRFTPAALTLAAVMALTASAGLSQKAQAPQGFSDQRATAWMAKGAAAQRAGDLLAARDAYETAMLLSPGDPSNYIALASIARAQKLPGLAIRFYNEALRLDPQNQAALQGQGLAMVDKGAMESARETLAKLQALCKGECPAAQPLANAVKAGPPKIIAAEDVNLKPKAQSTD
jgi:tetratricopeptide (TPR) repeat protein